MIFQAYQHILNPVDDSLTQALPIDLRLNFGRRWALIDDSQNVAFDFQTILSMEFADDSNVVTSIIENGSFVSYNKTELPTRISMTVVLNGTESVQQTTLTSLRAAKNSTDVFSVVTPFETYDNMNITALRYSRTVDRGATRTILDIVLQEIREVSVITQKMTQASQVKNATAVKTEKIGKIETKTPKINVSEIISKNTGSIIGDA